MEFNIQIKNQIKNLSLKKFPEEICGFIYSDKDNYKFDVYPCKNKANNKTNNFIISPQDYLNCQKLGKIVACYHSHCNDNIEFSEIDKNNSNIYKINYMLYNVKHDHFNFYFPGASNNPYIGRPFLLGKSDCFTLMKEYALKEEGVKIDFPKELVYPRNLEDIKDLYENNFKNQGFSKLDKNTKLEKSDGIMMKFTSVSEEFPTHAAVYLGNGLILHQPFNSFSCVNIYDNFFKKHTSYVLRYKELGNGKG
jgi:proteasome lid subunit RPN8/RPN11